jgi:hypothetical protein
VRATSPLGVNGEDFPDFAGLLELVTGACLGLTVTLGVDLGVLPLALVGVTSSRVGLSMTGPGEGSGGGRVAALTTRPPG